MEIRPRHEPPEDFSTFYIQATESIQERWPHILKSGSSFALFDMLGDVIDPRLTPGGIFHHDTRHLSGFALGINGQRPLLLSSRMDSDNVVLTVDLSNPDIYQNGKIVLPRESLHARRSKFLWEGCCYERVAVRNFEVKPQFCWLTLDFGADFADLFEIRGMQRAKRGALSTDIIGKDTVLFRYAGLDGVERCTELHFSPAPQQLDKHQVRYALDLDAGAQTAIIVTVRCLQRECTREPLPKFSEPYRAARRDARRALNLGGAVTSTNELPNRMFARARADLNMLTTVLPTGPYPYAGTPWFSTPFGRDGIITALEMLWIAPELARGVLGFLAANQARVLDDRADAEPGKILHETRDCEMANLGEVPFGHYYGSIDSTPLFVMLAARYFTRTGDKKTIRALWPHIDAALNWIDTYGDRDGDGFVEYYRMSNDGLSNQGWKDSQDSVMHADGRLATGPIALCEVQAYVYAAKKGGAGLARMLGDDERAAKLETDAQKLRVRFEQAFWCEDLDMYALALDGDKQPCRVRSSNAGQTLFCGIADPARAARMAGVLLGPEMFSGWGIRTLASGASRFNPMSYHNGSIWPHDNALIALGLAQYGFKRGATAIFQGLFDAICHMPLMQLPELFCGFARRRAAAPTLYPVACHPQAWASVTPFAFLEASLGIVCDEPGREIRFHDPKLPRFLGTLTLTGLTVGDASVDLRLIRRDDHTDVTVMARSGDIAVKVMQ